MARIGIIGGSGIYDPDKFETIDTVFPDTEFGKPSDEITIGRINGVEIAFIPRHGKEHQFNPSTVPYRANVKALKDLGVEIIISPCAVGSLQNKYKPGDLVIPDQFIDFTKKRDYTFFDDCAVHISIPDPLCAEVSKIFADTAAEIGIRYHDTGTYVCIEGPRFSTKAESNMFRKLGGDIIGMTLVPECQLARELGMCYCSLSTITDYDVWKDEPVDIQMVLRTMKESFDNVMDLLRAGLPKVQEMAECCCKDAAKDAGA